MAAGPDKSAVSAPQRDGQRLDKWLWFARIVKSRTLAASHIADGKIRVNREKVDKPSHTVKPGDVITSAVQRNVRILRVTAPGTRRGPVAEAQALYEDLSPPPPSPGRATPASGVRDEHSGRPTKRDRRQIDKLRLRG